jgi:formate dehydrogenase
MCLRISRRNTTSAGVPNRPRLRLLGFDKELPDAEIVISQPFWPAYMTKERFDKAKKLELIITAGIGSDHTDLQAAMDKGITVAEVTFSNSISVAEHVVMMILALVRNYIPSYGWVVKGGWNIADSVERSYDLEGMNVPLPLDASGLP